MNTCCKTSHLERCVETKHDWRNGMTPFLQVVQVCAWCGYSQESQARLQAEIAILDKQLEAK